MKNNREAPPQPFRIPILEPIAPRRVERFWTRKRFKDAADGVGFIFLIVAILFFFAVVGD